MSNIINSHINNINNVYTQTSVSMGKKSTDFIKAPNYIPKYSITDALNERDEFRHLVSTHQSKALKKKEHNFPKSLFFLSVFAGTLLLSLKKCK